MNQINPQLNHPRIIKPELPKVVNSNGFLQSSDFIESIDPQKRNAWVAVDNSYSHLCEKLPFIAELSAIGANKEINLDDRNKAIETIQQFVSNFGGMPEQRGMVNCQLIPAMIAGVGKSERYGLLKKNHVKGIDGKPLTTFTVEKNLNGNDGISKNIIGLNHDPSDADGFKLLSLIVEPHSDNPETEKRLKKYATKLLENLPEALIEINSIIKAEQLNLLPEIMSAYFKALPGMLYATDTTELSRNFDQAIGAKWGTDEFARALLNLDVFYRLSPLLREGLVYEINDGFDPVLAIMQSLYAMQHRLSKEFCAEYGEDTSPYANTLSFSGIVETNDEYIAFAIGDTGFYLFNDDGMFNNAFSLPWGSFEKDSMFNCMTLGKQDSYQSLMNDFQIKRIAKSKLPAGKFYFAQYTGSMLPYHDVLATPGEKFNLEIGALTCGLFGKTLGESFYAPVNVALRAMDYSNTLERIVSWNTCSTKHKQDKSFMITEFTR